MRYLKYLYTFYPSLKLLAEYRYALKLAKKYACKSVLDVGCGKGTLGRFLIDEGVSDIYVGMDVVDIFSVDRPNAFFVLADGRHPPIRYYFDCIFFVNSIFYIGYESIKRYKSMSKYIMIIDIDPRYPHIWLADRLESRGRGMRISRKELVERLIRLGFQPIEVGGKMTYYVVLRNT